MYIGVSSILPAALITASSFLPCASAIRPALSSFLLLLLLLLPAALFEAFVAATLSAQVSICRLYVFDCTALQLHRFCRKLQPCM